MKKTQVTELIVVRHGQTAWNIQGRHQGHLDSDLSETGIRQAKALADRLSKLSFTAFYSSDLKRALHTAEYIAQKTGHPILADPRLRERNYGIFRGMTVHEIQLQYPDEYGHFISGDPDYVIPEGQSARQKFEAAVQCAKEIVKGHVGERIVIVSHGGVLDALLRHTCGIALSIPRRFKMYNASLNTFFIDDGIWKLNTWGDICHLKGIDTSDDT
ncbi:MAG: histidine phosphatase family protein [Phycisphaerae bacterium]